MNIKQVVYTNILYDIVLEFGNSELKTFSISDHFRLCTESYDYSWGIRNSVVICDKEKIVWNNEVSLSCSFLYEHSLPTNIVELENTRMTIGQKNQAPTEKCSHHHVYFVALYPFKTDDSFVVGESIHGGFGESGGETHLSLDKLLIYPNWKKHFELADCYWAVEIIENEKENLQQLMNALKKEMWKRQGLTIML